MFASSGSDDFDDIDEDLLSEEFKNDPTIAERLVELIHAEAARTSDLDSENSDESEYEIQLVSRGPDQHAIGIIRRVGPAVDDAERRRVQASLEKPIKEMAMECTDVFHSRFLLSLARLANRAMMEKLLHTESDEHPTRPWVDPRAVPEVLDVCERIRSGKCHGEHKIDDISKCRLIGPVAQVNKERLEFIVGMSEEALTSDAQLCEAFSRKFGRYMTQPPLRELSGDERYIVSPKCIACTEKPPVVANAMSDCRHVFMCIECDAIASRNAAESGLKTATARRTCWICRKNWTRRLSLRV